jgi:Trypsin-like peptidase domain/PKD-like domain
MADGNITSTTVGKVWTLRVSVPNALNIGLIFSQFNLSTTAEMYIFNEARTVLDSSIKKSDFTTSATISVMPLKGNSLIIYIIEPNNFSNLQSSISIQNIEAGFQEMFDVGDVSSPLARPSINCDPSVQCRQDKFNFARTVARFATNGFQGTGTLINNEASNGRAYFLTAFHIIDIGGGPLGLPNGVIDPSELAALVNARFQFQFWRTGCNSSINNTFIQFTGATLRASSRQTDVVLLELSNPPGIGDLVNYAGWSRETTIPTDNTGFVIHHPQGEDMRITIVSKIKSWFWNSNYWTAHYSSGTVDKGSSGSALFNAYGLIVGQLRSGWSNCNFTDFGDRYGKFDKSWNGAGLQTWLSPTQVLQGTPILNLTEIPINGPSTVGCTILGIFSTLPNLLGVTYQWTVSAGVQINSGQGTSSVNISSINSTISSGTLTLTLRSPSKGRTRIYTVAKQIIFGTPPLSITSTRNGCSGSYQQWNLVNNTPNNGSNWLWSVDYLGTNSQITINTPSSPSTSLSVKGGGTVKLNYTDLCGAARTDGITVYSSCPPSFTVAPNPAQSDVTVSMDAGAGNTIAAAKNTPVSKIYKIKITDRFALVRKLLDYKIPLQSVILSTKGLEAGIYSVSIFDGTLWSTQKLVVQ